MGIMASIVWMIIIGFIVGALARFFYPGAVPMGFWLTAALGDRRLARRRHRQQRDSSGHPRANFIRPASCCRSSAR